MPEKPGDKLKKLKEELQGKEKELGNITKERDTLKGDIASLEKIVAEVKQILDAYKQALQGIKKDKEDLDNYSKIKEPMIEAAIKDKKKDVEDAIKQVDDEIKKIEEEVKDLKKNLDNAKNDYETAKKSLDETQHTYDSLKVLQKKIGDNLKELKSLKDLIEKEEDKNKTANMYFLFLEFENLLKETEGGIKKEDDLESALYEAWTELDEAKAAFRKNEEQLKTSKVELEAKEKDLESAKNNRKQNILKKTDNL